MKSNTSSSLPKPIVAHRPKPNEHALSSPPMLIPPGVQNRLRSRSRSMIVWCASGGGDGKKPIRGSDLPRSGAPRRFSSEVRAQVTALACSLPRSYGVPLAHWSRAELARHAATVPTLPTIEARTIGRWLTAEQVRPWQFHSWQHIQDPETFLQRARPVLQLSEHATALRHRKASGSSVPMKKPRSKPVRQNRPLVQPCQNIQSISPRAIVAVAHCS